MADDLSLAMMRVCRTGDLALLERLIESETGVRLWRMLNDKSPLIQSIQSRQFAVTRRLLAHRDVYVPCQPEIPCPLRMLYNRGAPDDIVRTVIQHRTLNASFGTPIQSILMFGTADHLRLVHARFRGPGIARPFYANPLLMRCHTDWNGATRGMLRYSLQAVPEILEDPRIHKFVERLRRFDTRVRLLGWRATSRKATSRESTFRKAGNEGTFQIAETCPS